MTDILADWKDRRFVFYRDYSLSTSYEFSIFLTDYVFWGENIIELQDWCDRHRCIWEGMVVNSPDEATLILFALSWS